MEPETNSPQREKQTWSVIIVCYNESALIESTITRVQEVLGKIALPESEVIIVDDGSTDNSPQIIKNIAEKFPNVHAIFHSRNQGIGMALRSGYANARCENISTIPADCQFDPYELVPYSSIPPKTFVSFYRKGRMGYSLFRRMLSSANRIVNSIFLDLHLNDVNWCKIYKNDEIKKLNLEATSTLVESEICAKLIALHNRPVQVASSLKPRRGGKSRGASVRIMYQAARDLWRLIYVVNKFKKSLAA